MTSNFSFAFRRPILLCVPLLIAIGTYLQLHWLHIGACSEISREDESYIRKYVGSEFGLRLNQLQIQIGKTLPGSCMRQIVFSSPAWTAERHFILSENKRYLFSRVSDLSQPAKSRVAPSPQPMSVVPMQELLNGNPPSVGPLDAPITLIEFSDFQCPFCERFAQTVRKTLATSSRYKVRLVFREFPLPIHNQARLDSALALCVHRQNNQEFWALHDYFFDIALTGQSHPTVSDAENFLAKRHKVDLVRVKTCVDTHQSDAEIDADIRLANSLNITGTPTFFINSTRNVGAIKQPQLEILLEDAISKTRSDNAVLKPPT